MSEWNSLYQRVYNILNIFYNNLYNRVEPRYKPAEMYVAGLDMRTTRQQLEPRWISIKSIISDYILKAVHIQTK